MGRLLTLVAHQPFFQQRGGGEEVVADVDEQIDVVDVLAATEAVGEVVAWIDGGAQFAAMGALEAVAAFDDFGGRGAMA